MRAVLGAFLLDFPNSILANYLLGCQFISLNSVLLFINTLYGTNPQTQHCNYFVVKLNDLQKNSCPNYYEQPLHCEVCQNNLMLSEIPSHQKVSIKVSITVGN